MREREGGRGGKEREEKDVPVLFDLLGGGGGLDEVEGGGLCCRSNCVTDCISASSSNGPVTVGRVGIGTSVCVCVCVKVGNVCV